MVHNIFGRVNVYTGIVAVGDDLALKLNQVRFARKVDDDTVRLQFDAMHSADFFIAEYPQLGDLFDYEAPGS